MPQQLANYEALGLPTKSDGIVTSYPANTTKPPGGGPWEYFRPVQDQEPKDVIWRTKTAKFVAQHFELDGNGLERILYPGLPERYKLFEHVKCNSDGNIRTDTYLFGHPSGGRFRSPNEFNPHILWLYANDPENQIAGVSEKFKICECRFCVTTTKTPAKTPAKKEPPPTAEDWERALKQVATEERMSEQESPGWVLRKGEIVWMWTGKAEALDNMVDIIESPEWAAGIVCEKPSDLPPFHPRPRQEDFAGKTYVIELCQEGKPGKRYEGVQQHFLMPWLARKEFIQAPDAGSRRKEHPSLAHAREVVETCSPFDRASLTVDDLPEAVYYNGLFLGAEKIFVGEPIRVISPDGGEDVLVPTHIYVMPVGENTDILFTGDLYTVRDFAGRKELTPEQFIKLPFRMRFTWRTQTGRIPKWARVNNPDERATFSVLDVLGRWYEYQAIHEWRKHDLEEPALGVAELDRRVADRREALGWSVFNGIDLDTIVLDDHKPFKSVLATNDTPATPSTPKQATPSAATSKTPKSSRMAMAAADDEDEDEDEQMEDVDEEDEEDDVPPRKKMALGSSR